MTINGHGAGELDRRRRRDQSSISRHFNVAFNGVTIQHGLASGNGNRGSDPNGSAADGAAYTAPGQSEANHTIVVNNLADAQGGGI